MIKLNFPNLTVVCCLSILVGLAVYLNNDEQEASKEHEMFWSTKKAKVKSGEQAFQKPDGFLTYYSDISKRIDEANSSYAKGYRGKALASAAMSERRAANAFDVTFTSRGPGNVGGRTRAIAIDPEDPTHCTWIAGAASGGIWKTTDCGQSWTNISDGLPNLSTNSIAQSLSNPEVIYVGTGEVFGGNTTFVRGDGIYKSTNRGANWTLLTSTVDKVDYLSVNRIAVDPSDENKVVIATNTGIYKSSDGGVSWNQTYEAPLNASVQDLQVDPSDFSIQYAGVNSEGIFKSTDAGLSWQKSSVGISDGVRFEIAVAPSNPNIIYTSSYVGSTTLLYYSDDKAATWVRVVDNAFNTDFLGAQGWYDNAIEVNPYNPFEVFIGGVNIGKFLVNPDNIGASAPAFLGVEEVNTNFLDFVNFGAAYSGGTLDISDGTLSPSDNPVNVEIRWGGLNSQKAHRFVVPANSGSNNNGGPGVPITQYTYVDYVDVPFEVWDVDNNRQLMVSFRDQENNDVFNLNQRDVVSDPDLLTAREYLYIHDITYNAAQANNTVLSTSGGIQYKNMYYFWPVLAQGATWNPPVFNNAVLKINYGSEIVAAAKASAVYDAYGAYQGENQNSLHPDHHNLTFVKTNEASNEFMVVNGNDGAFGLSTDNGVTFVEREKGYVTSQFYGADKKPGEDKYIGGTQDNGTWVSVGANVDANSSYTFVIGGDGFEVMWHAEDPSLVMGTIYNNRIYVSRNGGASFASSSTGITQGDGPFITRLASSKTSPEVVFAVGASGVYKTTNFGESWSIKGIPSETWGANNSANDVEVSLANDKIVWAGAGMASGVLDIFVSTNQGESFQAVNIPSLDPRAYTTGIYTHPLEENTAYVLFSVAGQAKILRTEDLGQTWEDISGFGSGSTSNNGFPDVFTHSLLVMPFNTDIIWAGTEIGLFESLDNGASWSLRQDIPSVSIWSMKVVDDQVVMGTHGRGIWTATISELNLASAAIKTFDYAGYGKGNLNFALPVQYDRVSVLLNNELVQTIENPTVGNNTLSISNFYDFSGARFSLLSELDGVTYQNNFSVGDLNRTPQVLDFYTSYDAIKESYPITIELENNDPFSKIDVEVNGQLAHVDTQQLAPEQERRIIQFDYEQKGNNVIVMKAYINGYVFDNIITSVITAAKQERKLAWKVYPVPSSTTLNVETENTSVQQYTIYSVNGRMIRSATIEQSGNFHIDVRDLARGMYLLQLKGLKGELFSQRFVKK